MTMQGWGWRLTALGLGAAQAASLTAPWNGEPQGTLQILALALWVWLLRRVAASDLTTPQAARRALVLGWWHSTAALAGTFWWLYLSMHTYGELPAPVAALAVLVLAGALATFYALAASLFVRVLRRRSHWPWPVLALVFALCWTLAELVRGRWLTGFPWGAVGYAHTDSALAVYAPWVGVYGVGALALFLAALLAGVIPLTGAAQTWRSRSAVLLSGTAVLGLGLALPAPGHWTQSTGHASVALLQGNIGQAEKFQPATGIPLALNWYREQLMNERADLIVAPETALPLLLQRLPEGYLDGLRQRFASGEQAALIGVPLGDFEQGYTNSVMGLAPGQSRPYLYHKHHLVPFGEFVPPFFRWFVNLMQIPLGDFSRGAVVQPPLTWHGQRYAPNICYEDLFGEELAERFVDSASAPTVLVNVSNIAWFGGGAAIDQHLQISRMRSLELERPMLRATNTGPTVVIDHRGQVSHSLPRLTRGVLRGEVEGRSGLTPYARWVGAWGLTPLWLLALGLPLLAWLGPGRRAAAPAAAPSPTA